MLRARKPALIKNDLKKMIDAAIHSDTKVILMGVPEPQQLLLRDAELYSELADETGVLYLPDTFSDVLSDDSLTNDHLHPNANGYAIIAKKIYGAIKETL